MRRILYDKNLDFEINLIGYKGKGESIVFFLKADGKAVYTGLVDCYEEESENAALQLLEKERVSVFDFVCWTHPHDDHTLGLDKILQEHCNENTFFWMPPITTTDMENYCQSAQKTYIDLFKIIESRKRKKMHIYTASDSKKLEKFVCSGNASTNSYIFEIWSFAPDTNFLLKNQIKGNMDMENLYSIGLVVNIGHFYIVLAGDVENYTLKSIPELNFDLQDRVDYVKIPHHASKSASFLVDRFNDMGVSAPSVATTTLFRGNKLPDKDVLKKYFLWGKNIEIYSTGNINNPHEDKSVFGIIRTSFDILNKKEIPIETQIDGNAICVDIAMCS